MLHSNYLMETDNGKFIIQFQPEGVFLCVFEIYTSSNYILTDIIEALKERRLIEVYADKILDAISPDNLNDMFKVAELNAAAVEQTKKEAPSDELLAEGVVEKNVDPILDLKVSPDKMQAILKVDFPSGARALTREDIEQALQKAKVIYGIDNSYLDNPELIIANESILIAQGLAPVKGDDAYIHFYYDLENIGKPKSLENGKVDYRNLNLFVEVVQGDIIAKKVLATEGKEGYNVYGVPIKVGRGKDMPIKLANNNVAIDENYNVVAMACGHIFYRGGKIGVSQVIDIKSDIGPETGNIKVEGDVRIKGSVQSGFFVSTSGDIFIEGGIYGSAVVGNNITVRQGIQTGINYMVKAHGNLTASFIENSQLEVGDSLSVADSILNSTVKVGKNLNVGSERGKGLISGGYISAGELIDAKIIGSKIESISVLEVGNNPMLKQEYLTLKKYLVSVEDELDKTQKTLKVLQTVDVTSLPPQKKEVFLRLTRGQFKLMADIEKTRSSIVQLELQLAQCRKGRIKCKEIIYPGVKMVVNGVNYQIMEPMTYISFIERDGEVSVSPY